MQSRTSVLAMLGKSSILKLSLHGIRGVIEREFGLDNIIYATNETARGEVLRRQRGQEVLPSEFAWINMSGVTGVRDRGSTKTIQKYGFRAGLMEHTRNTSRKAFLFPIDIGLELHYVNTNPDKVIQVCEALAILSMTDGLSFQITVGDFSWETSIEIPLDFSIPIAQDNDNSNPMAQEVTANLIAHTRAGFFRDVAAVTGAAPHLTTSMKISGVGTGDGTGEFAQVGEFDLDFDSMESIDGNRF